MLSTVLKGNVVTASEISSRVKWNWNLGFGTSGQSKGIVPFDKAADVKKVKISRNRHKTKTLFFTWELLLPW